MHVHLGPVLDFDPVTDVCFPVKKFSLLSLSLSLTGYSKSNPRGCLIVTPRTSMLVQHKRWSTSKTPGDREDSTTEK